jgi:hypothetical protein
VLRSRFATPGQRHHYPTKDMPRHHAQMSKEFASIEEILDFWDTHTNIDIRDSMEASEKRELEKLYALLGLSKEQIAHLEVKAHLEDLDSRQLLMKWIAEHL